MSVAAGELLHNSGALEGGVQAGSADGLLPRFAADHATADNQMIGSCCRRLDFCEALLTAATAYGIAGCWQWKPLLDGKQVGGRGEGAAGLQLLVCWVPSWDSTGRAGSAAGCRLRLGLAAAG